MGVTVDTEVADVAETIETGFAADFVVDALVYDLVFALQGGNITDNRHTRCFFRLIETWVTHEAHVSYDEVSAAHVALRL